MKCPLCSSTNSKPTFNERGYQLLACQDCELFHIFPYPESAVVHKHVREYDYDDLSIVCAENHYRNEVLFFRTCFPRIRQECVGVSSILDVGCGCGHLLELLKCFPDLYRCGVEPNRNRARLARKKAGCEVWQVPLERLSTDRRFEAITMINVLSHVADFDELFQTLNRLLVRNGRIILKVGEMNQGVGKLAQNDWSIPDHLHFLGLNTVTYICKKYGYEVDRHDRVPLSEELFSSDRWKSSGRSNMRNLVKKLVLRTPYALSALKAVYELLMGRETVYSSFIVLRRI